MAEDNLDKDDEPLPPHLLEELKRRNRQVSRETLEQGKGIFLRELQRLDCPEIPSLPDPFGPEVLDRAQWLILKRLDHKGITHNSGKEFEAVPREKWLLAPYGTICHPPSDDVPFRLEVDPETGRLFGAIVADSIHWKIRELRVEIPRRNAILPLSMITWSKEERHRASKSRISRGLEPSIRLPLDLCRDLLEFETEIHPL
jgi:hypothetical protein